MSELRVPVIDLAGLEDYVDALHIDSVPNERLLSKAKDFVNALTRVGFVFVSGHGIHSDVIQNGFQTSFDFFELSESEKSKFQRDWENSTCGYLPLNSESLAIERFDLTKPQDKKQVMDVCHLCEAWPSEKFKEVSVTLIAAAQKLIKQLLVLVGLALLPENPFLFFNAFKNFSTSGNTSLLRYLNYPPVSDAEATEYPIRCAPHTDYGCFTLVFLDSQPGLQVQSRAGDFVDITSNEDGAVLVNIGDLMHRWTGGILRSAPHRVVIPKSLNHKPRYSIVYFSHCDDDLVVSPVCGDKDAFQPILTKDHFRRRFKDTFQFGKGIDEELFHPLSNP